MLVSVTVKIQSEAIMYEKKIQNNHSLWVEIIDQIFVLNTTKKRSGTVLINLRHCKVYNSLLFISQTK